MDQRAAEKKAKTSKSRRETAVQGTNDNSIVSKCSMSAAGYFEDAFLQHFVARQCKRAPLINRGYYLRAVCVDQVLRQFLAQNPGCNKQIISLGAGFDSAFFRLKADGLLQDASFYEVDFPEVVKRKHAIIQSHEELWSLIQSDGQEGKVLPPIELSSCGYYLLGVDLTQLNTLEAAVRLCGADFDKQTLLLSECVMTYMTRRCSSALVKWAGETFQDAVFVMFEQINPDDAFGSFMRNHFHTVGSPLKCITSFPTLDSQNKRYTGLGWQHCRSYDLNDLYRHLLSPGERARVETLDPFDEYEEFNLKCAHYFLLVASTSGDVCDRLFGMISPVPDRCLQAQKEIPNMVSVRPLAAGQASVKRFSHSSVMVGGRYVVTAGGFGEVDGRHQRVQEVSLTDTVTMETKLVRCRSEAIQYSRMHHTSVVLPNGRILLCGGRQSPFFLCSQLLLLDVQLEMDLDPKTRLPGPTSCSCRNNVPFNDSQNSSCRQCSGSDVRCSACDSCSERNTSYSSFTGSNCDNHLGGDVHERTEMLDVHSCERGDRNCGVPVEQEECTEFEGGRLVCCVLRQSGDVPCPRWRHASTLVQTEGGHFMVLHGGRRQQGEVLADTYMLDVRAGVWTKLNCSGEVPGPRHSHALVTWEDRGNQWAVMTGGLDEDQEPHSAVYMLDVASASWHVLSVTGGSSFFSRYSHTCHVVGDKMVLVGGVNLQQRTPGVGIVNLRTGVAQEFSFPNPGEEGLLMFHRHCSVLMPDNRVIVLGGGGNCFSFGTHLNRTPVTVDISDCLLAFA